MKKAEAIRAISKAYSILHSEIEHMNDLKKNNLTLAEYYSAISVMESLRSPGKSTITFLENVAQFFCNCGFNVDWINDGTYRGQYRISC